MRRPAAVLLLLLAAVVALLGGALVGVAAAVLSSWWWGLALGVAATIAAAVAAPPGLRGRVPFCAGWAVVVARLALRRPEGDYVLADGTAAYVLLALAVALVTAALVTAPPPRLGRSVHGPS